MFSSQPLVTKHKQNLFSTLCFHPFMLYARRGRDVWIVRLRWEVTDWFFALETNWYHLYWAASTGTIDREHQFAMRPVWWLPNILSHTGRLVKYVLCNFSFIAVEMYYIDRFNFAAQQISVSGANTCSRTCRGITSTSYWRQNSLLASVSTSSSGRCMLRTSS